MIHKQLKPPTPPKQPANPGTCLAIGLVVTLAIGGFCLVGSMVKFFRWSFL